MARTTVFYTSKTQPDTHREAATQKSPTVRDPTVLIGDSKLLTAEGPSRGPWPGWCFSCISLHMASKQQLQLLGVRRRDGVPPNRHLHQREPHAPDVRLHGVVSPLEPLRLRGKQTITPLTLARLLGLLWCFSLLGSLTLTPYTFKSSSSLLHMASISDLSLLFQFPWPLPQLAASAKSGPAACGSCFVQTGPCPAHTGSLSQT